VSRPAGRRQSALGMMTCCLVVGFSLLACLSGAPPEPADTVTGATVDAASAATGQQGRLAANPRQLQPAEVSDYQGQSLSPRAALPDNSIAGPQYPDAVHYRLRISGLVDRPLALRYEEVLAFPVVNKVITLNCVEGWSADLLWTGVLLENLLQAAGWQETADTLIFVCLDGYETTMELAWALERDIILAWATNGLALEPWNGAPFQVAAEEKWGYKWAKWVTEIRVVREPDYRGYWERRGFSVDGTVGWGYSQPADDNQPAIRN